MADQAQEDEGGGIPVYWATSLQDHSIPPEVTHAWVVGEDGIYRYTRNGVFEALVKVSKADEFGKVKAGIAMVTPIPADLIDRVVAFFGEVWKEHKAEACVYLLFDRTLREWDVYVPEQEVTGASCNYGPPLPGLGVAGSIHSHGSMAAFHSGTDEHDELDFDGVHITVGKLDKKDVEFACSLVVSGVREKCRIEEIVAMPPPPPVPEVPKTWMDRVKRAFSTPKGGLSSGVPLGFASSGYGGYGGYGGYYGGQDDWDVDGYHARQDEMPRNQTEYLRSLPNNRQVDDTENVSKRVARYRREQAKREAQNGAGGKKR